VEAGFFGGEASSLPPPVDETLKKENQVHRHSCMSQEQFQLLENTTDIGAVFQEGI